MVCSFCGTENRTENRFCGACGVRLERRMADRRVNREAVQLKCPSCNQVNDVGYKFCGQCGGRIDRRVNERRGSAVDTRATAGANASLPPPDDARWRRPGSSVAISGEREVGDRESDLLSPPANPNPGIFVSEVRREDLRREDIRREDLRNEDLRNNEALRAELAREELRRDMSLRHDPSHPEVRESPVREASLRDSAARDTSFNRTEPKSGGTQITGPSFLGIGNDSESEGEYLLEDESGSGAGIRRLILLVVLAAIVGLIFMQWRSNLKANPKTPELSPSSAPARQGQVTVPSSPAAPGKNLSGQETNAASEPGTVSANSRKAANESNRDIDASATSKNSQTDQLTPADDPGSLPNAADRNPAEASDIHDRAKSDDAAKGNDPAKVETGKANEAANASTSSAAKADPAKTSAVVDPATLNPSAPVRPSAALLRAQQFLQGRGVPQNCEQGLIYLRAAAQKNEPAAAVQMGALYSAGHCVKQDRVMAYRWFNSAHELQPANQWIQKSMDQLWAQMNEQERRLSGY